MSVSSNYRVNYQLKSHRRDCFIEYIKSLLFTPFSLEANHSKFQPKIKETLNRRYAEVFEKIEELIEDHRSFQAFGAIHQSKLSELVPNIGSFFTELPLVQSFQEYDQLNQISSRRFIPPSFNDTRHILNRAQIRAISKKLKLISFDADQTIYQDGKNLEKDSEICHDIIALLRQGLIVAIVTAASYPTNISRYETRLAGLLHDFKEKSIPKELTARFYLMGGECCYLFKYDHDLGKLVPILPEDFRLPEMAKWSDEDVNKLLDVGEKSLKDSLSALGMGHLTVLRKPKSVGIVNTGTVRIPRENLEEIALAAQYTLIESGIDIPFCAFNGGADVWIDIGNKLFGVQSLQSFFSVKPEETIHIGDQFLSLGNDIATRRACATCWISSERETIDILQILQADLEQHKRQRFS